MKKAIAVLLILGLLGGGGYFAYEYKLKDMIAEKKSAAATDSEDAVFVDSVSILAGLGNNSALVSRYAGVVEPQKTLEIKLENERTVEKCYVSEGDEVKSGQKLFTYKVSEQEDKLESAQIELEKCDIDIDSAQSRKAQYEKELAKATGDDKLTLQTQILSEETAVKTSEYEKKVKEAEIKQLKETIENADVFCEMDGVVKTISSGDSDTQESSSGGSVYMTILALGDYRIKGTVNEQNINNVFEGMEMLVHSRLDESVIWHGTITEINRDSGNSNTGDSDYYSYSSNNDNGTNSTNYPFYVELDSSEGLLLGQHVYLEQNIGQEEQRDGIWLDDYYFNDNGDGTLWVWAVSSQKRLEKREVTLGEFDEEAGMFQVLSGLDAEDYICQDGPGVAEGVPVIYNDYSSADDEMSQSLDWGYGAEEDDFAAYDEGDEGEELYFDEGSGEDGFYDEEDDFYDDEDFYDDDEFGGEYEEDFDDEYYEDEDSGEEFDYYDADEEAFYDGQRREYYTTDEENGQRLYQNSRTEGQD